MRYRLSLLASALVALVLAAPVVSREGGGDLQWVPPQPNPLNTVLWVPQPQEVSNLPTPQILTPTIETPTIQGAPGPVELAPSPRPSRSARFVVVRREVGKLVVKSGLLTQVFWIGPMTEPLPEGLNPGTPVEVTWSGTDTLVRVKPLDR
ncbi:MAG TPA: hypothetical protein VNO81_06280 [Candidatus Nitrosotenuis sp.]|jgi:hypothetical protein|nr:hypothetical protein [Candidatus Nitrosotenuis sp.]